MALFGFILGIALGSGIAFFAAASWLNSSNNIGDSKGTVADFSNEGMEFVTKKSLTGSSPKWMEDIDP